MADQKRLLCSVGHSDTVFDVKTGVRQGRVMSVVLFNLVIDWVMRKTTEDAARVIRWTFFSTVGDLDSADDLANLSYTHRHIKAMQHSWGPLTGQVTGLCAAARQVGEVKWRLPETDK